MRGTSLDVLMRALWQHYGLAAAGVPEDGIERIATELGGAGIAEFFARHVRGTEDPPLADLLGEFGVALKWRPAESGRDRGGKAGSADVDGEGPRCWIGASLAGGANPTLQHVFTGGPAERAGLAAGDAIVAIDGLRASVDAIESLLRRRRAGEALAVHAFRRDELFVSTLTLADAPADTCWLTQATPADDTVRARRDDWLGTGA
jgi:predicted metalloprotease with PDZ domain